MKSRKPAIAISLLIIALGIAWLLNTTRVNPRVDWIWVVGLGISGVLLLTLARLDRFNFIVGTTLIICSILSVLRQTGQLKLNIEAPVLVICVGVLLLFAHLLKIPGAEQKPELPPQDPKI